MELYIDKYNLVRSDMLGDLSHINASKETKSIYFYLIYNS